MQFKKRIVRCQAFLNFYREYREKKNLDMMLVEKRNIFFSEFRVFNFDEVQVPSMKHIVIVYDAILSNNSNFTQVWNNDSLAFSDNITEEDISKKQYLYRSQIKLWSLKRYFGSNYQEIVLPKGWRQNLTEEYSNISFEFLNYDN